MKAAMALDNVAESFINVSYLPTGWIVHQRVAFIEKNWPYFLGFGLPLAVVTALPNSLVIRYALHH